MSQNIKLQTDEMKRKSVKGNSSQFLTLRRRLDMMGYEDFLLGLDSAPLAQQMLEDMVTTTEALRESEEKYEKTKSEISDLQMEIQPLNEENHKLRRDNNQLHSQIIELGDECLKLENNNSSALFSLQAENRRLLVTNEQLTRQNQDQVGIINSLRSQLNHAMELASSKMISGALGKKSIKPYEERSPRTKIVEDDSPYVCRPLVNEEREKYENRVKELENIVTELTGKVENRDDEIERLSKELEKETGRNGYLLSMRGKYDAVVSELDLIKKQVTILNPGVVFSQKKSQGLKRTSQMICSFNPLNITYDPTEKDNIIAELLVDMAFVADSIVDTPNETKESISTSTLEKFERSIMVMKNEYENRITKLQEKINSSCSTDNNTGIIAKLKSEYKAMKSDITEKEEEIHRLKKELAGLRGIRK